MSSRLKSDFLSEKKNHQWKLNSNKLLVCDLYPCAHSLCTGSFSMCANLPLHPPQKNNEVPHERCSQHTLLNQGHLTFFQITFLFFSTTLTHMCTFYFTIFPERTLTAISPSHNFWGYLVTDSARAREAQFIRPEISGGSLTPYLLLYSACLACVAPWGWTPHGGGRDFKYRFLMKGRGLQ